MEVPGYSAYLFIDGVLINKKTNKKVTVTTHKRGGSGFVKLKNDSGEWKSVSVSKIEALCNPSLTTPPEGFYLVPGYTKTYISKEGAVWVGPGVTKPLGGLSAIHYPDSGYPTAGTEVLNGRASRPIHQLLALTFLDCDYLEKGLCVMHLDDNKFNYSLTNLKIGTYSENNKAAYDSGANPRK